MLNFFSNKQKRNLITVNQRLSGYWELRSEQYSQKVILTCKEEKDVQAAKEQLEQVVLAKWKAFESIDDYLNQEEREWLKKEFEEMIYLYHEEEVLNGQQPTKNENDPLKLVVRTNEEEQLREGIHVQNGLGIARELNGTWSIIQLSSGRVCEQGIQKEEQAVTMAKQLSRLYDWKKTRVLDWYQEDAYLKTKTKELRAEIENGKKARFSQETVLKALMSQWKDGDERWLLYCQTREKLKRMIAMESVETLMNGWVTEVVSNAEQILDGTYYDQPIRRHIVMKGGPGTGKTTVVRMISDLLYAIGLHSNNQIVEIGRDDIVSDHIGGTEKNIKGFIEDAYGGVMFIDEAYSLTPSGRNDNDFGRKAIDILVDRMEKQEYQFMLIVAGYPQKMDEFLRTNAGLSSRFSDVVLLRDLNLEELCQIAMQKMDERDFQFSDGFEQAFKTVLERMKEAGKMTGNVRDVEQIIASIKKIKDLQYAEGIIEEKTWLTIEDLKALPKGTVANQRDEDLQKIRASVKEKLERYIGNSQAKKQIYDVMEYFDQIRKEKEKENWLEPSASSLNMNFVLTGPSGTGKTEWAKLIGEYLKGCGLLSSAEVAIAAREDFVDDVLGGTAKKTKAYLETHLGGVVFADEFYRLVNGERDDFGREALDTILPFIWDRKEDISFIIAGYKEEIDQVMKVNPGMTSRFRHTIEFMDYTAHEILEIIKLNARKRNFVFSEKAETELKELLRSYENKNNAFNGNGRWAENFVEKIAPSLIKHNRKEIQVEDVHYAMEQTDDTFVPSYQEVDQQRKKGLADIRQRAEKELADIKGLEEIKDRLNRLMQVVSVYEKTKKAGIGIKKPSLHTAFIGPSGTGKTTVAKVYAQYLKGSGMLARGVIVEGKKSEVMGHDVKETIEKTKKILAKARGGILFFDNMRMFLKESLGETALEELVQGIREEKNDVILFIEGQEDEASQLYEMNREIGGVIGEQLWFPAPDSQLLTDLLIATMETEGFVFEERKDEYVKKWIEDYEHKKGFFAENARWVKKISQKIIEERAMRIAEEEVDSVMDVKTWYTTITEKDVRKGIEREHG